MDFSYWDGAEWQTDARKSQRIAGITKSVSEQFNVVELEEIMQWYILNIEKTVRF